MTHPRIDGPISAPTVHGAFAATAARWPARPFLAMLPETAAAYGTEAGEISYGEAETQVAQRSRALERAGFGPGHRLMLLVENRPDHFLWWLAANSLGASVVPVNPDLRAEELEFMVGHVTPSLAIAAPDRVRDLAAAADAAGHRMPVAGLGADLPSVLAPPAFDPGTDDGAREAAVLYTSGSTGRPKGCVLSNLYFTELGNWYATEGGACTLTQDGERMLTPLPVFHMNAMGASFMAMVAVGGCLIALDRFHPKSWWASVAGSRATCLHYLGVMPSILMRLPETPQDRAHSVRFGFGAGIDPKLHAAFEARFGFPMVEGWAMTETGAGATITNSRDPRRVGESCLGRPHDWLELRVVDEAGQDAGPDCPGELLVRKAGPDPRRGFFSEYWKDPEATAQAWAGGWFHTGDVVRRNADGEVFFVDRRKNVIRRSGENIAAVEVESVLARHPEVRAVGIAAVPDALRGDEVFACIVTDDRSAAAAERIVRWALDRMAYYKVPGWVGFVDALPLTATQKIQRAELKALAARLVDDPATVDTRALKKRRSAGDAA